jgi:hypothetical protein
MTLKDLNGNDNLVSKAKRAMGPAKAQAHPGADCHSSLKDL